MHFLLHCGEFAGVVIEEDYLSNGLKNDWKNGGPKVMKVE